MSATEHLKAALERFKLEDTPGDSDTESYELNNPELDHEDDHPEYPSRSAEPSVNSPATG